MKSVIMEIALLKTKSLAELQEMWEEYFNEPTISLNKEFFVCTDCIPDTRTGLWRYAQSTTKTYCSNVYSA